jgi:hypothetical protein
MRAIILLHRWLGVAFCLLFVVWFASGIVMHFVPFPHLTETERFAGLARIDLGRVIHGPGEALHANGFDPAARIRLIQRSDGPVYVISDGARTLAVRAFDLSPAVATPDLATAIAADYARQRGWNGAAPIETALTDYDQWSVQGELDRYRPLYRVALNDADGMDIYVASTTGEVVQLTTRRDRAWNYVGSIPHWIYVSALRARPLVWSRLVWTLALLALIGVLAGSIIGSISVCRSGLLLPYRGWQALHYWLGLACGLFVLTWIFSGWLSMDDGLLFSSGTLSRAERAALAGDPAQQTILSDAISALSADDREVEWFTFGGSAYRRERSAVAQQKLFALGERRPERLPGPQFLTPSEVDGAIRRLSRACVPVSVVGAGDAYSSASVVPGAPVYRAVCGAAWYQIDGATGAPLEKLDRSRRLYRWLFAGLHTLDIPQLTSRPLLRTALIVGLCLLGLVFSATGVVIAARRLLRGQ